MKNDELIHRIDALSEEARKLLLIKIKGGIKDSTIKNNEKQNKHIVAYVKGKSSFNLDRFKLALRKHLPDYMVPTSFIELENMPLLPNGKIDRSQLSKLKKQPIRTSLKPNIANNTETQLVKIWEEVLNVKPIHATDNFFEVGGDSILSIQVIAKARKKGIEITPNQLFEHQTIAELVNIITPAQTIGSNPNIEKDLITIWENVLNVKPILKTDNFFEVGGDSILSIQVIAKARKKGIEINPNQLFEHQTISELLQEISTTTSQDQQTSTLLAKTIQLTPIQHWFFDTHKNAPEFWNQGLVLSRLPNISKEIIEEITSLLIKQHDSLRLSFKKENNTWAGHLLSVDEITPYKYVNLSDANEKKAEEIIKNHLNTFQENLNLSEGNLFKCFYFKSEDTKLTKCILIAHHLVVDAVSWNIISDDFTDLVENFNNGIKNKHYTKTTTIDKWATYLKDLSKSEALKSEVNFWKEQTNSKSSLPEIKNFELPLFEKDIKTKTRVLNQDDTQNLLVTSNKAYNTKVDDLLIAALSLTIGDWSKNKYLNLGLERHGRETINTDFDLSRTVNWHTSYFPIRLKLELDNIELNIKSIKEQLRAIPNKGLGYGVLKYLNPDVSVDDIDNYSPDIVFNYLGVQNEIESQSITKHTLNNLKLRDDYSVRYYLFEINTFIKNNRLTINWSYSDKIYKSHILDMLIAKFENNLKTIITHCLNKESSYTPSDFPDALLDQDDLDNLLNSLD